MPKPKAKPELNLSNEQKNFNLFLMKKVFDEKKKKRKEFSL